MLREGSQRRETLEKAWRGDGTEQGAASAELVAEVAEAGSPEEIRKQTSGPEPMGLRGFGNPT